MEAERGLELMLSRWPLSMETGEGPRVYAGPVVYA